LDTVEKLSESLSELQLETSRRSFTEYRTPNKPVSSSSSATNSPSNPVNSSYSYNSPSDSATNSPSSSVGNSEDFVSETPHPKKKETILIQIARKFLPGILASNKRGVAEWREGQATGGETVTSDLRGPTTSEGITDITHGEEITDAEQEIRRLVEERERRDREAEERQRIEERDRQTERGRNRTSRDRERWRDTCWDYQGAGRQGASMGDNSVTAPSYSGRQKEDVKEFVRDFMAYTMYKQLRPLQAFSLLGIVLKDKARDFYNEYERPRGAVTEDEMLKKFLEDLEEHFRHELTLWTQGSQIMDMKQKNGEKFEEWALTIQKLARKVSFDAEKTRMLILHGALPKIKQAILLQGAQISIQEMERVALLVEVSQEEDRCSLEQALKRVELKVDSMNMSAILGREAAQTQQVPQYQQPAQQQPSTMNPAYREQSQERGGFNRNQNQDRQYNGNQGGQYQPRGGYQGNRGNQRGRGSFQQRGGYQGNRQNQYQQSGTQNQYQQRPQQNWYPQQNQYQQGNQPENQQQTQNCTYCGNMALHAYTQDGACPAKAMYCYNCGRQGHMKRVCRQGRVGPNRGSYNA
jgi:hypothetical protein